MKYWIPATLSLLTLALWTAPAHATEMKPNNATEPALIRGGPAGGAWYAVPTGGALNFDVMGPATLEVEIVQRLPSDAAGPKGQVQAKGDGMDILTVKIDGDVGQGSIMDGQGGTPSVVGKAKIKVPAGQHVFSLEPVSGSLPMLARVDGPESAIVGVAPVMAAAPEPAPEPESVVSDPEPEPVVAEAPVEVAPAPADPAPVADPVAPEPEPELTPVAEVTEPVQPPIENTEAVTLPPKSGGDVEPTVWVGARTGLGSASAGNQASLYLGLEVLYKLSVPQVHVGARLGRYGIGLEQELAIQPPIGGTASSQTVDWNTRVRPLELGARYTVPMGGIDAYGWGALAAYSSTRIDGEDRTRGLSLGTSWAMGLDFDAGRGVLSPELAFNLGSRDFGNTDPQGEDARERLTGSRLNLAYRIAF